MAYAGFTLLVLFIFSTLFVIGVLIYEHYREQYTQKLDGTSYNYLGKIHNYSTREVLYVLQSSKNGDVVAMELETLNKNFKKK